MDVKLEVKGMDDAVRFMKGLEEQTARKVLISALRDASKPLIKAAKQEVPVAGRKTVEFWGKRRIINPGVLKKSIRAVVPKRKSEQFAEMYIGPIKKRKGKTTKAAAENTNDAWYRHFVIRGTAGFTVKKGKNKGKFMPGQAANPFMDRAASRAGMETTSTLEKSLTKTINKYIARTQK